LAWRFKAIDEVAPDTLTEENGLNGIMNVKYVKVNTNTKIISESPDAQNPPKGANDNDEE
jgi:hypothetical protein